MLKYTTLILLGFCLMMSACKDEPSPPTVPPAVPPIPEVESEESVTFEEVKEDAAAAAKTTGEYVSQQTEQLLASFATKFDELKVEAQAKGDDAMAQYDKLKEDFDEHVAVAKENLAEFKAASGEHVDAIKQNLSESVSEANEVLEDAISWFRGEEEEDTTPVESE